MMNHLLILTFLISANAFALPNPITVDTFTLERLGGGQNEVVVNKKDGVITAFTKSCHFKKLTAAEQEKTKFTLLYQTEFDANKIFKNEVTLASDESITGPMQTGSWTALHLTYSFNSYGVPRQTEVKNIDSPIVLINGQFCGVLEEIEGDARVAAKEVCGQ